MLTPFHSNSPRRICLLVAPARPSFFERLLLALTCCTSLCALGASAARAEGARYVIADLDAAPSARTRATLTAAGFRELASLPGRRLLLERSAGAADGALRDLPEVIGMSPFRAAERISRELLAPAVDRQPAAELPLLIHLMPDADPSAVTRVLAGRSLPVLGRGVAGRTPRISTLVPRAQAVAVAEELGDLGAVLYVERVHHLGLFNDRSAGTVQSGMQGAAAGMTPIWAKGLRGEGQVVGLIDTGVDLGSCWFSDPSGKLPATNTWSMAAGYGKAVDATHRKVLAYDFLYSCDQYAGDAACDMPSDPQAWDSNGHGTHCSGNMAGDREGTEDGMAPAAKIVVQDGGYQVNACADLPGLGCPLIDLYPLFEQAYDQGARVHNNSYGDNEDAPPPGASNYTARSQDVDRFVWDHKDMLIVFAAGNSGSGRSGNLEFSVASPSTNKNGLSVGSVRTSPTASSDQDMSSFSSRGWTADGRIKPDLLAPGCNTSALSGRSIETASCMTDSGCGTSYAAPTLVGVAALVRQYLTEGFYPSGAKSEANALSPSAALLKAMLLNGSVPITGLDNSMGPVTPIPSNEQGWGLVQLDRVLLFQGGARTLYLDDHTAGFDAGALASVSYTFTGVDPSEPFKVTLAWTDFPGMPDSPPSAPQLDDLEGLNAPQLVNDLDLTVKDAAASYLGNVFSDGKSSAGGSADRRNNVEQVLIGAPSAGEISVTVSARSIVQAGQDYALVATGKWTSAGPTAQPGMPDGSAAGSGGTAGQAPSAGDAAGAAGTSAAGRAGSLPQATAGSAGSAPPSAAGASGAAAGQGSMTSGVSQAGSIGAASSGGADSGCSVAGPGDARPLSPMRMTLLWMWLALFGASVYRRGAALSPARLALLVIAPLKRTVRSSRRSRSRRSGRRELR